MILNLCFFRRFGARNFEFEDDNDNPEQELIILNLVSMDNSNFDMNQVLTC